MCGMLQLEARFWIEKQEIAVEIDVSEVVVGTATHVIHFAYLQIHIDTSTGFIVGFTKSEGVVVFGEQVHIRFVANATIIFTGRVLLGDRQSHDLGYLSEMMSVVLVGASSQQQVVFFQGDIPV